MTREKIDLLFIDLCGRLPYGIVVHIDPHELNDGYCDNDTVKLYPKDVGKLYRIIERGVTVKPYLFPMSSMTEEQKKEYRKVCELDTEILENHPMDGSPFPAMYNSQDWLNKHHFDYRGLIPIGLANDATGKNIYL